MLSGRDVTVPKIMGRVQKAAVNYVGGIGISDCATAQHSREEHSCRLIKPFRRSKSQRHDKLLTRRSLFLRRYGWIEILLMPTSSGTPRTASPPPPVAIPRSPRSFPNSCTEPFIPHAPYYEILHRLSPSIVSLDASTHRATPNLRILRAQSRQFYVSFYVGTGIFYCLL